MPLGEVFLGALLTVLVEKLASGELLKLGRVEGIEAQLKKWSKKLMMIQAVLADAESKDGKDSVNNWLYDIQVLALDLDDVVDELATKALQHKLRESETNASKVRKFLIRPLGALKFNREMAYKIKEISRRLEEAVEQIKFLELVENVLRTERKSINHTRFTTTSLVYAPLVYGRENDKERIVKLLLESGPILALMPIVGMGGIGKTTLAQLIYNDSRVKLNFRLKAWTCVSDDFDVVKLTRSILEQVSSRYPETQDFNLLQLELKEKLSKERFLLVLDDVWNEDYCLWETLCQPFLHSFPGSKIIVTTRNDNVARIMSSQVGSHSPYRLLKLNNEDGLSLLAQHAIGLRNFDLHPQLKAIGQDIVRKCEHLPLAIKTLGGALQMKLCSEENWRDVLKSEIWDTERGKSNLLPALKLSYNHLPSHLKQCFAFCSIFPKDHIFDKHELVLLWMAQGFVPRKQGRKLMQDIGEDYFEELFSRSLFQRSTSKFVMHDLIVDLARYVAGKMCVRLDDERYNAYQNVSHSSYTRFEFEISSKFQVFHKASRMRTFLPLPIYIEDDFFSEFFLSNGVLVNLVTKLGCLRVLSLSGYSIYELPNSIGKLKHLRYLNLSGTKLRCLPKAITSLCNLQTLLLRKCKYLTKLPTGMRNLVNLVHLDNADTNALCEMPSEISELESLQSLPNIVLSSEGLKLKNIGNLSLLKGSVSISGLQNEVCRDEAVLAKLKGKPFIDELRLSWSDYVLNENLHFDILESLEPNPNLKVLEINSYRGTEFPSWVGNASFSALVKIKLYDCFKCTSLPSLGQFPLLQDLSVDGMYELRTVGAEFYGYVRSSVCSFPSLQVLTFSDMEEWEDWSFSTTTDCQFPRVEKFYISGCRKLMKIPVLQLHSLRELELKDCNKEIMKNFTGLISLIKLKLRNIKGLTCFSEAFSQLPSAVEDLTISHCDGLVCLWETGNEDAARKSFTSLRKMRIENCPKLVSLQDINSFPMLQSLKIQHCLAFEFLPKNTTRLQKFEVINCPSLKALTTNVSFKRLGIRECATLELASLEQQLKQCRTSLEVLWFLKCSMLTMRCYSYNFTSLGSLFLLNCDGLQSFPEGGLTTPNLQVLFIDGCKNLKCLPNRMDETLVSLTNIYLNDCLSLENFPQGDFPSKLTSLCVSFCSSLKPLAEWGLHRLTSLKSFSISGGYPDLVSFQQDDTHILFPSALTSLTIAGLPLVEFLPKCFQDLSSLQSLSFRGCPKLRSLAPMDNLLDKLHNLNISCCPLLQRKYFKYKGKCWPLISNIPSVFVDDVYAHDPMFNQVRS